MSEQPLDVPTFGDKVRYQVDRFLSWSPMARFLGLFGLSFILISICAGLAVAVMPADPEKEFDFLEAMWWAMTRVADAGTMGDDSGTLVRFIATLSTLSGVMVVALLIGLVSSTIGDKLDDLRKGKSPVIDNHHTLILGFGDKVFTILRELRNANSNQKNPSVVILSTQDKEEVETAVREQLGDMKNTRVVVRQGSPYAPHDLRKVGAGRARSIIIMATETGEDGEELSRAHADMNAIKTLLALRRIPGALKNNHVTIELLDSGRRSVVERLGAGGAEVISMHETLSRMMVQTARQSGLAVVYRDLLTYDGSEFYFKGFPELAGQPFGPVQWRMAGAVVVGVRRVSGAQAGQCIINPPDDFLLKADDELLVLAEDDDTFSLTANHAPVVPPDFKGAPPRERTPEKVLLCGVGSKLVDVLRELDNYALAGSEAWLMPGKSKDEFTDFIRDAMVSLRNLKLKYVEGDPTLPDDLKRVASSDFSVVLVMADDELEPDEADAKTVITVLLMRDLLKDADPKPRIISEILDPRTKDLVEQDYGADFVVSSEITSMLLTQVSERRELNAVFADMFDADGNEIYLKRAACYAVLGRATPWLAIQKVARQRGEVAIGYLKQTGLPVINPPQDEALTLAAADRIIVVSEDDSEEPKASSAATSEEDAAPTMPSTEAVAPPAGVRPNFARPGVAQAPPGPTRTDPQTPMNQTQPVVRTIGAAPTASRPAAAPPGAGGHPAQASAAPGAARSASAGPPAAGSRAPGAPAPAGPPPGAPPTGQRPAASRAAPAASPARPAPPGGKAPGGDKPH